MSQTGGRFVPYQQEGEPARKAAIARVEIDLQSVSQDELQVLGHLVEAVDAVNPIFRDQFDPRTAVLRRLVTRLIGVAEGEVRAALRDYRTVLDLQNGPFAGQPHKNHLLTLPRATLQALARKAGDRAPADLEAVGELLTRGQTAPDKANFYPADLTEAEFAALGPEATRVNSSVMREATGQLVVVGNETRYRTALRPVVEHLRAARDLTHDVGLRLYLDAKILEIETGSEEARRVADAAWVRHTCPIDVVISSAIEVYLDRYKNARGAAAGGVYLRNQAAEARLRAIVEHVPQLEAAAPWTHKRLDVDLARLPKLKYVDVLAWSGDYVGSPGTTLAQSLPNDEWVGQNLGAVNMVFVNTSRLALQAGGRLDPDRFLTRGEADRVRGLLFEAYQTHNALHEIGHSTGKMDPAHSAGQPRDYLQAEQSWLEEARAELFGLWAFKLLVDTGVVSAEQARAAYDAMLLALLSSLKFEPVQAHTQARTAIFHYLEERGVITRREEGGATRFQVDPARAHAAVSQMLQAVADLRSSGDKAGAAGFRRRYVYTDPLKDEIEARTADLPLGLGLIFPRLAQHDGRYQSELVYPHDLEDQVKFNLDLPT